MYCESLGLPTVVINFCLYTRRASCGCSLRPLRLTHKRTVGLTRIPSIRSTVYRWIQTGSASSTDLPRFNINWRKQRQTDVTDGGWGEFFIGNKTSFNTLVIHIKSWLVNSTTIEILNCRRIHECAIYLMPSYDTNLLKLPTVEVLLIEFAKVAFNCCVLCEKKLLNFPDVGVDECR